MAYVLNGEIILINSETHNWITNAHIHELIHRNYRLQISNTTFLENGKLLYIAGYNIHNDIDSIRHAILHCLVMNIKIQLIIEWNDFTPQILDTNYIINIKDLTLYSNTGTIIHGINNYGHNIIGSYGSIFYNARLYLTFDQNMILGG